MDEMGLTTITFFLCLALYLTVIALCLYTGNLRLSGSVELRELQVKVLEAKVNLFTEAVRLVEEVEQYRQDCLTN